MNAISKSCLAAALAVLPVVACGAQSTQNPTLVAPAIGAIAQVDSRATTMWGMSGMDMILISQSSKGQTPIMRTLTMDARTVEILSRVQAPPLRPSDIRVVTQNGRELVGVRGFLLAEVMPADATAAHMSRNALAQKWALSEYNAALLKGTSLSPQEREQIAQLLVHFTGLPIEYVRRANLRIGGAALDAKHDERVRTRSRHPEHCPLRSRGCPPRPPWSEPTGPTTPPPSESIPT